MKNPVYYRLIKDGSFVGFKRIVTEYLPAAHARWQLTPIPHDSDETQKLSKPAMGIGTLGREKITSHGQTSPDDCPPMPEVKLPKPDNEEKLEQSETTLGPSDGGLLA